MATGRTVAATELTILDRQVIELCESVSKVLRDLIPDNVTKRKFWNDYGKVNYSRDAGVDVAGGKLQRDALCTRGRQGKAPFSNRNLRWHPLAVAHNLPPHFKPIGVELDASSKELRFRVQGKHRLYTPEDVHELPEAYCISGDAWTPLVDMVRNWSDNDWTRNSCIIAALEYSPWQHAVETFAVLGIAVAVGIYDADLDRAFDAVLELLSDASIGEEQLPTPKFPSSRQKEQLILCPLCRAPINGNPAGLQKRQRPPVWQPSWRATKREEGEDSSLQIMHVNPLIELEVRHDASNVRYGHRWCNVAMGDHSEDETLAFMQRVVVAHRGQ